MTQYIDSLVYPENYHDPNTFPLGIGEGYGNRDNYEPLRVPEGYLFLMGDNRDVSSDSRYWGLVSVEQVTAKPVYIYWASDKGRIGMSIR